MMKPTTIQPGIYEHYKGKQYEVLSVATHSETMEELVVYKALYASPGFREGCLWVRPLNMFLESLVVNGESIPRFRYLDSAR